MLLTIIGIVILFIVFNRQSKKTITTKRGSLSYNFSNKWNYKFRYLDGVVVGRFKAKNDTTRLIYSSKLEEGEIVFRLYNQADSLLLCFNTDSSSDTITGIFEMGKRYKINANAQKAKGQFNFKME